VTQRILFGAALLEAGQGGIARVARMSVRALAEQGAAIDLVSLLDKRSGSVAGVDMASARGSKIAFGLLTHYYGLRATHGLYDFIGTARAHPRLLRRIPYAFWMMGIESWEGMRKSHIAAARRAQLTLAISRYTLERHQSLYGPVDNARVCWLGTEQDEAPERLAHFSGAPYALCVARIDASENMKGHSELVACWPGVVAAVPRARLVIVGGGSGLEALRAVVAASPAHGSIDVLGFMPEEKMPALFENAHVFVMPSRQEGFGIVYAEAMRFGLPVIASRGDAGQEINVDGQTGYTVAPAAPQELGETLVHLLRAPDRCAALGAAGFERWRTYFRYSCFAGRFLAIWNEFSRDYGGAS